MSHCQKTLPKTLKGVNCHIVNKPYPKPSKRTNVTSSIELTQNPQRSSWQGGDHQWRQGQGEEGDEAGRQDTEMVTSVTRAPHILKKRSHITDLLSGTVSTG